jgi:hypothetical protein
MINSETYDNVTSDRERADLLADLFDMDLGHIHNIYIEESLVRFEMTLELGVAFVVPGEHTAAAHLFAVIK